MATTKQQNALANPAVRKPKLPIKQIKYIDALAKGKSKRQAGLTAGAITEGAADKYGTRMSSNVRVQEALQPKLAKHNITLDTAIAPIGKALVATKVVIHGNKEDAFAEVVEDLDMQLKGSDRALKLMGIGQGAVNVNVNFNQLIMDKKEKYGIGK